MNKSQPKSLKTVFSGSWHFLLSPSNSSVQVHDNESRPVIVHVPLHLHGCDLQGLTKEMKHYDWQRKRCLKRPFFIVPVPCSQFCPTYPSAHSQL